MIELNKQFPHPLRQGRWEGIPWCISMGPMSINGYIELPEGHPWLTYDEFDHPADVHGGVTYDVGRVQGFDTCHAGDKPHPHGLYVTPEMVEEYRLIPGHMWTADEVQDEVIRLAHQAAITDPLPGIVLWLNHTAQIAALPIGGELRYAHINLHSRTNGAETSVHLGNMDANQLRRNAHLCRRPEKITTRPAYMTADGGPEVCLQRVNKRGPIRLAICQPSIDLFITDIDDVTVKGLAQVFTQAAERITK